MSVLTERTKLYNDLKNSRKNLFVEKRNKDISITKSVTGKPVTAILVAQPNGKYRITPGKYLFRATTSNFDYSTEEHRSCRNQQFIFAVIDEIEKTENGHLVENLHEWVDVNKNNKRSNKTRLKSKLGSKLRV